MVRVLGRCLAMAKRDRQLFRTRVMYFDSPAERIERFTPLPAGAKERQQKASDIKMQFQCPAFDEFEEIASSCSGREESVASSNGSSVNDEASSESGGEDTRVSASIALPQDFENHGSTFTVDPLFESSERNVPCLRTLATDYQVEPFREHVNLLVAQQPDVRSSVWRVCPFRRPGPARRPFPRGPARPSVRPAPPPNPVYVNADRYVSQSHRKCKLMRTHL
jgi:hypothetical protein